ncbi:MAG: spermidine/putrescine ABC transporter substrate-binding protein [Kiritimatiellae bacterium]|nr:spermidine/putrescine ABC transporter substrate-binding protein [Kiritimatiellia bacterium]
MEKHINILGVVAGVISLTFAGGCGCSSSNDDTVDLSPQAQAAAQASGCDLEACRGGELHIYTWSDYIAPEVVLGFEKGLNCRVIIDTFDSNEAMYAKLKAGGTGYDLMTPTSYQIETMAQEKMIAEFDHSRIPNVRKNFDKAFENQIIDPSFKYNVPYAVTYGGFLYQKDAIPEDADVRTWSILGNSALRGRITLLDDIRETLGGALMFLGFSINSTNADELAAAAQKLIEWRVNVRKFDAESYKTEVPSGATFLGHGYSTDATQVIVGDEEEGMEPRDDIGFALPREGFSIAFDEFVLAAGSKRPDLAYAFINYIYEPEVAAANMNYICGPCPVKPGIALLDDDYRNLVLVDPETMSHGQVIRGFTNKPEVQELYNRTWDKVKATSDK